MWCCVFVWVFTWPPQEVLALTDGTYDRDLWLGKLTHKMSTCTFLSQILSRGTPGRFGNHSEFCSPSSSSLYPPVFVKVLLNKSIRTRRHRVWLPSMGTQMAWPGFQTYTHTHTHTHTHYDWLIQVLMVQTQQGSWAVWTGWLLRVDQAGREDQWRGTARREFLMGGEKHHKTHWLI